MLFAVLFTDKSEHGALRIEHLSAHIQWVDEHKDKVLVAGSLRQEPTDTPKGGLWVVEEESKAAVSLRAAFAESGSSAASSVSAAPSQSTSAA